VLLGILFSSLAFADGSPSLLSKQIGWTAANLDNPQVVAMFTQTFSESASTADAETRAQGQRLLSVIKLRERLEKCQLEQTGSLGIREAIEKALGPAATATGEPCDCDTLKSSAPQVLQFKNEIDEHFKDEARKDILALAKKNLAATSSYWSEIEKQNSADIAVNLTEREFTMLDEPPRVGAELLLYTDAIGRRKDKSYVSRRDVESAFKEVKTELKSNENYLSKLSSDSAHDALKKLITTNPGAVAQYLAAHPEALDMICSVLQDIDASLIRNERIDNAFFWGGWVVAGVLIASGVGAVAGGTMAGTLATVAAGTALVGTATGVSDAAYSANKTHKAFIVAQSMRSSAYAEGLSDQSKRRLEAANAEAYSELQSAVFATASILPYGAAFKVMKKIAVSSKLGSAARAAKEGAKVEADSVRGIASTLTDLSQDKKAYEVILSASKELNETEMAEFLGGLSALSKAEQKEVLRLLKDKPEKAGAAMKAATEKGICR
jgi:hypothetical protein